MLGRMKSELKTGFAGRKRFSHRRSKFPSTESAGGGVIQERMGEFQADQMITLRVGDADRSRAYDSMRFGKSSGAG